MGILGNNPADPIMSISNSPIQEEPEGFDPNYVGEITKAVHEGELTRDSTQLIKAQG